MHLFSLIICRFKVFADYEDYIKCQENVNALYKVCSYSAVCTGLIPFLLS